MANVLEEFGKQGEAAADDTDSDLNVTVARLDDNMVEKNRN